eukprot:SAG11_NODE_770_length_7257_cov_2.448449_6_plen_92_part_00
MQLCNRAYHWGLPKRSPTTLKRQYSSPPRQPGEEDREEGSLLKRKSPEDIRFNICNDRVVRLEQMLGEFTEVILMPACSRLVESNIGMQMC